MHDDERCFARRPRVWIDVPSGAGPDARLYVTVRQFWQHLLDEQWDWQGLPAIERVAYSTVCESGLAQTTRGYGEALELIGLEGMIQSYGTLPYPGALLEQPNGLLEAFATVRQTTNEHRLRQMREQQLRWQQMQGGDRGRTE